MVLVMGDYYHDILEACFGDLMLVELVFGLLEVWREG